jgi:hypothetical protein
MTPHNANQDGSTGGAHPDSLLNISIERELRHLGISADVRNVAIPTAGYDSFFALEIISQVDGSDVANEKYRRATAVVFSSCNDVRSTTGSMLYSELLPGGGSGTALQACIDAVAAWPSVKYISLALMQAMPVDLTLVDTQGFTFLERLHRWHDTMRELAVTNQVTYPNIKFFITDWWTCIGGDTPNPLFFAADQLHISERGWRRQGLALAQAVYAAV